MLFLFPYVFSNFYQVILSFLHWINKPRDCCSIYFSEDRVSRLLNNFCKYQTHFHICLSIFILDKWHLLLIISLVESESICWFIKYHFQEVQAWAACGVGECWEDVYIEAERLRSRVLCSKRWPVSLWNLRWVPTASEFFFQYFVC